MGICIQSKTGEKFDLGDVRERLTRRMALGASPDASDVTFLAVLDALEAALNVTNEGGYCGYDLLLDDVRQAAGVIEENAKTRECQQVEDAKPGPHAPVRATDRGDYCQECYAAVIDNGDEAKWSLYPFSTEALAHE